MDDRCCLCTATSSQAKHRRRNLSGILVEKDHIITSLLWSAWPGLLSSLISGSEIRYVCKLCFQTLETAAKRFQCLKTSLSSLQTSITATGLYSPEVLQLYAIHVGSHRLEVNESDKQLQRKRSHEDVSSESTPKRSILSRNVANDGNIAQTPTTPCTHVAGITPPSEAKLRSRKSFNFMQSLIGAALYDGHASKRTYTRLQKFGVLVSHQFVNRMVRNFGEGFDDQVMEWRSDASQASHHTPKYILVGDNVDKNVRPRFTRIDRQVQSIHAWHQYASLNRFDLQSVSEAESMNLKSIKDVGVSDFLPSASDTVSLRLNYIVLVARVLVEKLPFLHSYRDTVPKHIVHPLTSEMTTKSTVVPLGVIAENENKNEELVRLLEQVQRYVPHATEGDEVLQKCVIAGDQLTAERIYNIQLIRAGSENSEKRLDCFVPTHSDWHTQVVYLQTMMDRLYAKGFASDGGTLMQIRNLINRRSVAKDVSGRFNACIDFMETVIHCHIVAAALHYFNMTDLEQTGRPSVNANQLLNHSEDPDLATKWNVLKSVVGDIIDNYVILKDFVKVSGNGHGITQSYAVDLCLEHQRRIAQDHNYTGGRDSESTLGRSILPWLSRFAHLEVDENMAHMLATVVKDGVNNYARAVLTDGLLLMEYRDAIREGDGNRVQICHKFLMPYFFATKHNKYALECFRYLCAVTTTSFGAEVASQVKWGRFINIHGKIGRNVPADFHMEQLNKLLKRLLLGLGANCNEESMVRISKCINRLQIATNVLDKKLKLTPDQTHHSRATTEEDEKLVLQELVRKSSVFDSIPGRQHRSFVNMSASING